MKSWIILIVLAVALTAAFTVAVPLLWSDSTTKDLLSFPAPPKPDGPAPVAEVEEDLHYDFGTLPQQFTGHHTWTFKNTGPGPLELRGVTSTCSCTTADLLTERKEGKAVVLKPGESHPITVTFETKNWFNFHQTVTVATSDPDRPTIVLTVDGIARPAIATVPSDPSISFGPISNELESTRKIALFSADRPDLILTKVTSTNPALVAVTPRSLTPEEAKEAKAEKGYMLDVTVKPTSNLGAFAEEVLVQTDHPQKSELRFKVMGRVTGPITLVPEKVTVRGASSNDGGTEKLKIVARGRSSVKFTVDKKPKAFDVSIEPIPPADGAKGSMYTMTVKVIPGTDSGRIIDEIVLGSDDPLASEIKIPVDVLVEGAR
jgi:hypothetical protein